MNYDLDLRSSRYVNQERFQEKKPLFKALLIIFAFSPLLFYCGLNHYHHLLANQVVNLEKEVIMLRQQAEPLLIITSKLENMENRKHHINELKPDQKKWSAGLHFLHDAATAEITITRIEITCDGLIKVEGNSSNMHAPARYQQNLSDLHLFGQTELNTMSLNSNQNYTFSMTTQLSTGDETDDNTEKIAVH